MSCSGRLNAIRFSCDYWQPSTNTTNIEIGYPMKADAAERKSRQCQRQIHSAVILSWTKPKHHPEVYCPVCQAGLLHCPGDLKRPGELIVYSGPGGPGRTHMTVRFSRDGGETWPISKTLHQGPAAYSDLALLGGGEIGCLYERGDREPYERITFARFTGSVAGR